MKRSPLESKVVAKIIAQLQIRGGFWIKIHGSPMQIAGIPDIIGCYRGRFISFECKRDEHGRPTKLQAFMMGRIVKAGGIAEVVWNYEQVSSYLDKVDAQNL